MNAGKHTPDPRPPLIRLFALLMMAVLFTACAPDPSMIATLTLLPGTPTTRPPTPWPSITPRSAGTATMTPAKCPPLPYDTHAPEDASMMIGRHYDLARLPEGFQQPKSGALSDPLYRWVRVRWQERSLYWIERQVCIDASARPHWEVIDALALPRLDPALGEMETRQCTTGSQKLEDAIAFGMLDLAQSGEKTLEVQSAWSMRSEKGAPRFSILDTGDLTCVAEEAP